MSTAVASVSKQTGGKKDAETRISELTRERRELKEQLEAAHREIESLTEHKQEQQAVMKHFMSECEALCKAHPEFDECLRRIADIPDAWLREIIRMPNPAGFIVFLAGANEFLEYLRELRPEAAILRIRRAGYDVYSKLPKLGGKVSGNR